MRAVNETAAVKERVTRAGEKPAGWMHRNDEQRGEISRKELKKSLKNLLTKSRECGRILEPICEAEAEGTEDGISQKRLKKTFEKPLDKSERMW